MIYPMSYQLKDLYSPEFYERFSVVLEKLIPDFDPQVFQKLIFDETWESRELKDRMWHTSQVLHRFFPKDFKKSGQLIIELVDTLVADGFTDAGLQFMCLPDYVERYGVDDLETSLEVFEHLTAFASCEFAVRPFIVHYPEKMIKKMVDWSKHPNEHVRRLASEGSRPRLPWAMALPKFKKDPMPVLPILENLKNDESEYVRRSVANNLNDIAKDNPRITLEVCQRWFGETNETDRLVKHACRTLLKAGNTEALQLFGYGDPEHFVISNFQVETPEVQFGEEMIFSFQVSNIAKISQLVRLEYGMYFMKANGNLSKKVFKISEKPIDAGSRHLVTRKQSFKPISTRKYYPGRHEVSIIINGEEKARKNFELLP
jgi:3-methyladenine DNA glycosylase AlkC